MGFPLDRGSVEDGTLTCHWHHARFDLESGCTFDQTTSYLSDVDWTGTQCGDQQRSPDQAAVNDGAVAKQPVDAP